MFKAIAALTGVALLGGCATTQKHLTQNQLGPYPTASAPPEKALSGVYKYTDKEGNTYFSNEPLPGTHLRLEWHRNSKPLVVENKQTADKLSRNRVDEVAQDLARVLEELDDRKRKLVLLETLIMERDLKSRRAQKQTDRVARNLELWRRGKGNGPKEADLIAAYRGTLKASVVEKRGEAPMTVYRTLDGVEYYYRSSELVALKRSK